MKAIKILDLGCGLGYRTYRLSKIKYSKVIGIDISPENIMVSKKRYPAIDFRVMNAEKLAFKERTFDLVYAIDVLEHLEKLDCCLKEITRVLKPGGRLIAAIPGERSEKWLVKIRPSYPKEIHHQRIFHSGDLDKKLKKLNFSLAKCQSEGFLDHLDLYFQFKTKPHSDIQTGIGNWNDNLIFSIVHLLTLYFDSYWVFNSPLMFFPIWIITLPLGYVINSFGNKKMPKTIYYEFKK